MIHSEHDSHVSVGLFGAEHLLHEDWFLATIAEEYRGSGIGEERFTLAVLALTKTRSQWLKFRLVAQTCASKTSFAFLN